MKILGTVLNLALTFQWISIWFSWTQTPSLHAKYQSKWSPPDPHVIHAWSPRDPNVISAFLYWVSSTQLWLISSVLSQPWVQISFHVVQGWIFYRIFLSCSTSSFTCYYRSPSDLSCQSHMKDSESTVRRGDSAAQWLGRLPWDPEILGSRHHLTTRWICSL